MEQNAKDYDRMQQNVTEYNNFSEWNRTEKNIKTEQNNLRICNCGFTVLKVINKSFVILF